MSRRGNPLNTSHASPIRGVSVRDSSPTEYKVLNLEKEIKAPKFTLPKDFIKLSLF